MNSIWRIISSIVLVLVFLALSVFSLVAYKSDQVNLNMTDDKFPLAKITFTNLSYLVAYLENIPSLRLIPVVAEGVEYQKQILVKIDTEQSETSINKSNFKEETPNINSDSKNNIIANLNLKTLIKRLKDRLSENWFQS